MKIQYLDDNEQQRFFNTVRNKGTLRELVMFSLMIRYGLRLQECLQLKLRYIDTKKKTIFIQRLKGGDSFNYPLRPDDLRLIKRWLKERATYKNSDSEYLFISRKSLSGEPLLSWSIQKKFKQLCHEAEIPKEKSHTHVMRHTTAVNMIMKGIDVFDLKHLLGHKSISSTMIYLKLGTPELQRKFKSMLDLSPVY